MNKEQYKLHRAHQKRQSVIHDTGRGPLRLSSLTSSWNVSDIKEMLYEKQNGLCALCRHDVDLLQSLDHRLPLARGGTDELKNLQLVHRDCNQKKHARTQEEWEAWLLKNPNWISKYARPEGFTEIEMLEDDPDTDAPQELDVDFKEYVIENQIQVKAEVVMSAVEAEVVAFEADTKAAKLSAEREIQKLNNEFAETEKIRDQADKKLKELKALRQSMKARLTIIQRQVENNRIIAEGIRTIAVAEAVRIEFKERMVRTQEDRNYLIDAILLRAKGVKLKMPPVSYYICVEALNLKCRGCGYRTEKLLPEKTRYCEDCQLLNLRT